MKIVLSNNTEIEVMDGSTLFDILVEPSQYQNVWDQFTNENMKLVKLVSDNGDTIDQRDNLVVESEQSIREKNEIHCHFYLRVKNREELLEEKVAMLEAQLEVHDTAIGDLGEAVSGLAEEGGFIDG